MSVPEPAETAAARIARRRATGRLRAEMLRRIRADLRARGHDGAVRLGLGKRGWVVQLDPVIGVRAETLGDTFDFDADRDPFADAIARARRLALIADAAERRLAAIRSVGGDVRDPPCWSFLGHPLARGIYAALGFDLETFAPDGYRRRGGTQRLGVEARELTLAHAGTNVAIGSRRVRMDAAAQMARVRVAERLPESVVAQLRGRPLHEVLGVPTLEAGTPAGDAPLRSALSDGDGFAFTVECALEPLGTPPAGVDASFLADFVAAVNSSVDGRETR